MNAKQLVNSLFEARDDVVEKIPFRSSSDPDKVYYTQVYSDGSTSCNCPGWTRRVGPGGARSCKHTREVEANLASKKSSASDEDEEALAWARANPGNPKAATILKILGRR